MNKKHQIGNKATKILQSFLKLGCKTLKTLIYGILKTSYWDTYDNSYPGWFLRYKNVMVLFY